GADTPEKTAAARLARYRHYLRVLQGSTLEADERPQCLRAAKDDLEAAVRAAPADVEARLAAADFALQASRPDAAEARIHLAAIPEGKRRDLRYMILQGKIGLAERRPDDAIRAWRAVLVQTGGTNEMLTWELAEVLLEGNRVTEAEPLIEQF